MASPDPTPPASSADGGTVNRVLRILSAFAIKDRWSVDELTRALSLPRASTHRLLGLCKPLGYVEQDAARLYMPGDGRTLSANTLPGRYAGSRCGVLSGVGMRTLEVLELLEQDLRKPVMSAASAMMWNALRVSGVGEPEQGFGKLLREVRGARCEVRGARREV